MSKLSTGEKVLTEATVARISEDGAEVTVRLPHYGYPVTLPINSVTPKTPPPPKAATS